MARGIPRPSILEVPAFFSLLEPRGIDFINPRLLEVLDQNSSRTSKIGPFHFISYEIVCFLVSNVYIFRLPTYIF